MDRAIPRFDHEAVVTLARDALTAAGLAADDAAVAAGMLVLADLRGVESHGVARLPGYLSRLRDGLIDARAEVTVDRETPATLALCGNNGFGILVAREAMERCIAKAEATGLCLCTVRESNHFGITGMYPQMAAERGLGAMAMTNASRIVVPMFSREPMLGTNPLAFAVPTSGRPLVLDMSTSTVAWGKIEIARRAGLPIPAGWAVDSEGRSTTDPHAVKGLLPLGGDRVSSGHKGYGLGMLVDVFCGPLSGNVWSHHVASTTRSASQSGGTGHMFMAWRIDAFRDPDEFRAEMDEMIATLHGAAVGDGQPSDRVLVPGDPEAESEARCRADGIPLREEVLDALRAAIEPFGLAFALAPR